jgi:predicted TIM-barrel fold metal-dependent hydrolase
MPGVTDVHVHVEPYRTSKSQVFEMLRPKIPDRELASRLIDDPDAFLGHLDAVGVERACLINYVAPEVMGFTEEVNRFVAEFARQDRKRLIPFGSVHPKRTKDPKRDVERLASKWEMGGMKIHPPHQLFAANAYVDGKLPALRAIYKTAERLRMPVMIHTGTSVFPGARSKYGDPMALDDVAQDFPDLRIIMAHGGRPLWCDTAFYILRRHANVVLDISSIPPRRLLEWFPRLEEISEKVVFGSDWPGPGIPGIREEIEGIRALPLKAVTLERIFRTNAAALVK